jgi:hypothetical protein
MPVGLSITEPVSAETTKPLRSHPVGTLLGAEKGGWLLKGSRLSAPTPTEAIMPSAVGVSSHLL